MTSSSKKQRAHPNWLRPAQAGWVLLALASVVIFIVSSINTVRSPLPSCLGSSACPINTNITREDAGFAEAIGLPIPLLAYMFPFSLAARLSLGLVGLLIFWRRPDDPLAMIVSGAMLSVLAEGTQGLTPGLELGSLLVVAVGITLFLPVPFIFPTGRVVPRWTRWPLIVLIPVYVALGLFFQQDVEYPVLYFLVNLVWMLLAVYAMTYRYQRVSNAVERQQTRWVILGISAVILQSVFYAASNAFAPPSQPSIARTVLLLIGMPLYALSYGFFSYSVLVAVLRYRLWDIDVLIRRTLQYALLTGLLALGYFGGIVLFQGLFGLLLGETESPLITVVTTLGIAALFNPLRARTQSFIDRRFYRKKYNAEQTLSQFSSTARDEVDLARLSDALLRVVKETLQPEDVSLWMVRSGDSKFASHR